MYAPPQNELEIMDKVIPWLDVTKEKDGKFCLKEDAPEEVRNIYPEFCKIKFPEI